MIAIDHNNRMAMPARVLLAAAFVLTACLLFAGAARADFGLEGFDVEAGSQAGAHPANMVTNIDLNKVTEEFPFGTVWMPDGSQMRNVHVDLPVGFVGNSTAAATCTDAQLMAPNNVGRSCPDDSQVGLVEVKFDNSLLGLGKWYPLYNMVAPDDSPAVLAFKVTNFPVHMRARVRSGSDMGISMDVTNINQALPVYGNKVTIWGVPAASSHDEIRGNCMNGGTGESQGLLCPSAAPKRAFLTTPTTCDAPLRTDLSVTSWQGQTVSGTSLSHAPGEPDNLLTQTGCDQLPFDIAMKARPEGTRAGVPTGFAFDIAMPQSDDVNEATQSHLKTVSVTLPEGVTISPSSAGGLGACPDAQANLGTDLPPACPESSKVGSVEIDTPLLKDPMDGAVYLLEPHKGNLFRLMIVAEGPGTVIKLRGDAKTDPVTGQISATFDDNPQLPFSNVHIAFKEGPRAPLTTPSACGTYTTSSQFTAWNGKTASSASRFTVSQGCATNKFEPGFQAGTANPLAGEHSPFALRVTRQDGEQDVSTIEATLPKGLTAKLAGVPLCPEQSAASGDCPAASQVGTTTVGAGAGSNPIYVPQPGKAPTAIYLAGPYKSAPYSLVVKVPAQAGPFDLGTVAVRNALYVDPVSAQVSAKSDPLPQILEGIPIDYRDIRVDVNRRGFALNPTSCDPMAAEGTIGSVNGQSAKVSDRFQVAGCRGLDFAPSLDLKVSGATKRGSFPALRAEVKAKPGQANIGRVSVALPHSEFLAQSHIRTICTRVQYAAEQCPPGSVYGWARAFTPLVDQPLEGPVYLRSSSNPLPDLVMALHGAIDIDLAGRIDSVHGGIRNTFDAVPDAPISKFVLTMKGGKKGLLENSRNLCAGANKATVKMDGQNGKAHDFRPVVGNSCGKKRSAKQRAK